MLNSVGYFPGTKVKQAMGALDKPEINQKDRGLWERD